MKILLITHKRKLMMALFCLLLVSTISVDLSPLIPVLNDPAEEEELKVEIEKIYNVRSNALVTGDLLSLKPLFDISQKYGQWSLEHEVMRVKYLRDWSKQRGMKFTNIESSVRIKKIYHRSSTTRVSLEETYKFDYIYPEDTETKVNSFGVGIRHTLDLIEKDDSFLVYSDWYTDCFEDAIGDYSGAIPENTSSSETVYNASGTIKPARSSTCYNRQKAVEYADKYCGAAWGSGNNFKYNKKYMDYNGAGGDCTNFVSQVLGDKEGGGLPMDGTWYAEYYKYGHSPGSSAWVNASGLKNYLIYSGKGSVISKGTFKELISQGSVGKLMLGDLVCYEKKGRIDHFAVVTGRDSHGYPLINSHTTDRYHVPWDLGWGGSDIKFFLIHING